MSEALTTEPATGAEQSPTAPAAHRCGGGRLLRFLLRRPGLVLSLLVVAAVLLAAFWPDLYTDPDPLRSAPAEILQPPGARH